MLAIFAFSSGVGLWLKNTLPGTLYRLLTVAVPALFLLLPYWKPLRARPKWRMVINILFALSFYLVLSPVVDSFTGGSEWDVYILGLFLNAAIGAALTFLGLKIVVFVQNLVLAGLANKAAGQPQTAAAAPAGSAPSWELDRYPEQILWRSRVNDTAIAYVGYPEDPEGIMQPDRLYPSVCHRYVEENGQHMEVYFPVHEIDRVDVSPKETDRGIEWLPTIFVRHNGDTLGIYFTEPEFNEFFNVFNPIRTGKMG